MPDAETVSVQRASQVFEHVVAAGGEDALGVELDALDVELAVAHAHDRAVGGRRRDLEVVGQRGRVDRQRVVAVAVSGDGSPANDAGAVWSIGDVLPCISSVAPTIDAP